MNFWPVVLLAGVIAVAFSAWLARDVLSRDRGTKAMQEVAGLIFEGAMAFLNRQYRPIALLAVVAVVIIGALIGVLAGNPEQGIKTAIAFLVGAFCSGLAGFIGMYIAVQANLRTAAAAQRSVREAINVSLRGGAVSGFLVVALSLLGVLGIYAAFGGFNAAPAGASVADRLRDGVANVPFQIVGFGFGASFVALFAQLGGGIYTKAADVGADLVGKVEAGIPEDDPRNAAVVYITQYYTAGSWRPVQELAQASKTGPATNIISGVAVGFESTGITAVVISAALAASFYFGTQSGLPNGGLF